MSRTHSLDDEKLGGSTERVEDQIDISYLEAKIDPVAEKRLLRKLDLIILPQVTLLFLLNFIDRSNIGNANVAGFSKDIHLSVPKYEYNIALMLFYVAYIVVEIPSNLILKKIGSIWLAILTLCFASICVGTAFVKNFNDFVGVRIALGLAEGGVIPGIAYLCTRFYRRHELAARIGTFLSLGPGLSGAFGGLLAAGFLDSTVKGLHTWQKIFVLEGMITGVFAIVFFFTLPTSPEATRWLNEDERALAVARMRLENHGRPDDKVTAKAVLKAILNPYTWICTLCYTFINIIVQGTSIFLPTIIAGLGKYTVIETQLRTVPPYIVAAVWSLVVSWSAYKFRVHGYLLSASCSLSIIGYIIFLASDNPKALYGASFLTFSGALPNGPLMLSLATANAGTPTERAVAAAIVPAFGSIGSMGSVWLYLPQWKPRYIPGNIVNLVAACCAVAIGACLSLYAQWENRQRQAGKRDHRLNGKTEEEIATLGHRHPQYQLLI